jgi:hydrogenase maturation protease
MSLLEQFDGFENIVLIDAMNFTSNPCEVLIFTPKELEKYYSHNISSHDLGVLETLALGDKLGKLPTLFIVGINIEHVDEIHESDVQSLINYIKQLI